MNEQRVVFFRFRRADYFTPVPTRRKWETATGKELQAIARYIDYVTDELVLVYEVIEPTSKESNG